MSDLPHVRADDGHEPPIGVGIIGGGFMGDVHARAVRHAGARLVGVVTSSPEGSRLAARRLGAEHGHDDVRELLANPAIDVVHVCTPNALHAEQTFAALAAGKHVVCEKPLATDAETARDLEGAALAAGLTATVPFVYRFHPVVRESRRRIGDGELGEILTVEASYLQDWLLHPSDDDWRVDAALGGPSRAFGDIGSHLVDLLEFVTGDRITRLVATKRTFFPERARHSEIATEDAVSMSFEMAGGAIGSLLVSQVAAGRKNRPYLEVSGTRGSISFDLERPDEFRLGRREGITRVLRDPVRLEADERRLSFLPPGHAQGHLDAFTAFVADSYAAMRGHGVEGLPTFADGRRAAELTQAVLASSERGWVETAPLATTIAGSLR